MNELAQRTFVKSEAGRPIETTQTRSARYANTLLIEWIRVNEWSLANRTKILGCQRGGGVQAFFADRNPGPFGEGAIANPAIIGEK